MIVSPAKVADPVLRPAWSGIAHQSGACGGSGGERPERLERERRDAILQPQRDETGPRNSQVEAIVGLAARERGEIVSWSRREPDMPVLGGGDLRRVRLIAADEPSEQRARF